MRAGGETHEVSNGIEFFLFGTSLKHSAIGGMLVLRTGSGKRSAPAQKFSQKGEPVIMLRNILAFAISVAFTLIAFGSRSWAQSGPTFVQLGRAKGALYKPESGPEPHVGIIVMHREANYLNHVACGEFAKRGFVVLCMNSRFENSESSVRWELIPLDVSEGVNHLKKQLGAGAKIILYGHSGGGVTMSFYQAVAERGPAVCQGPNKLVQCGNELKGLAPAHGIILSDGHPGNPILRLRSVNPATSDMRGGRADPKLDPFAANNGFNPNGSSRYSELFKKNYFAAQSARMNRLIDIALGQLQRIETGKDIYTDDGPFNIPGFDNARLLSLDSSIRHTTLQPEKLLKNDGTVVKQVVESIAPSRPELARLNRTFSEGARGGLTVRSFLSSNAIRSTNSMDEKQIDLCSSNNSTPCMVQSVSIPLLAVAHQASFQNLLQEVEINYLNSKSADKDFIVVEGSMTSIGACTNCAIAATEYANARKNFFDYTAKWLNDRF